MKCDRVLNHLMKNMKVKMLTQQGDVNAEPRAPQRDSVVKELRSPLCGSGPLLSSKQIE